MFPFQERKKIRKIIYSKVSLVILAVVFFAVGKGAWGVHQKNKIALSERAISARSLAELQSRTAELQASLERLRSARGVEEEVRQKYTVARAGEEVVVVIDDNAKKSENGDIANKKSIWSSIASFFGF